MLKDLTIDIAPTQSPQRSTSPGDPSEKKDATSPPKDGAPESEATETTTNGHRSTPNELRLNRDLKVALYGCELINQAGIMLQVTQVVIATAQVLYHRFYRKKKRSHKDFPPFHVGMACVYLATKVEEEKRRHRDILNVFDRLQKKRSGKTLNVLDPYGKRYTKWKNTMMKLELIILCDLGYMMKVDHPHKFILNYINVLEAGEKVAQKAWSYLNDSLRIPKVIEIKPEVMACAAIFLAARQLQVKLPDHPPWFSLFQATKEEIQNVSKMIMELYKIPKVHFEKLDSGDEINPDEDITKLKKMIIPTAPTKKRATVKEKKVKKSEKRKKDKKSKRGKRDSSRERSDSSDGGSRKKRDRRRDRSRSRDRKHRKKKRRRSRSPSDSRSPKRSRSSRRSRKRHKRRYSASPSVGSSRSRSRSRKRRRRRRD